MWRSIIQVPWPVTVIRLVFVFLTFVLWHRGIHATAITSLFVLGIILNRVAFHYSRT